MINRGVIRYGLRLLAAAAVHASAIFGAANAAVLGQRVDNVATISYSVGSSTFNLTPPPASFTIEAVRTPSQIDFFRYAPSAPDATPVLLNGSDYQPGGSGAFAPIGPLRAAGGAVVNTGAPVPLTPATNYFPGEPIIIRVTDAGQNGDPNTIETIVATITSDNGDTAALRFYESGPDTGVFFAWIGSATGVATPHDATLTIVHGSELVARYQDPFDLNEVSTDTAGVDPFGRLFDSLTGALIDGVSITIVDAATGAPARVFGIDGVSAYPSTVVTGQTVTDGSGLVYPLAPGEFRFPIMFAGTYRVVFTPPPGYTGPSAVQPPAFAALANAPFVISPASYGAAFSLSASGGDVQFDIPIDPSTDVVVTKKADLSTAAIGDFVRYAVRVENRAATPAPARIVDRLPGGMRYQKGSARANGAAIADPTIAADGRMLTFSAGVIPPGGVSEIRYVVEVGAGAALGEAVNSVQAVSASGVAVSNRAEAAVEIVDDFLRSSFTIIGRVAEDACAPAEKARDGKGVPDVRLYMENGATVVTDQNGLYHFEDIDLRTHVVQVDEESLPEGYELVSCGGNTRSAGSARSQFVDVNVGALVWRANFHVRKTSATGDAAAKPEPAAFNPETEYLKYDKAWLEGQSSETAWAYPGVGVTPAIQSVNIGLKHAAGLKAELYLNGHKVSLDNFAGREVNSAQAAALSRWRGVDILAGVNRFEAVLTDKNGAEVGRIARSVDYIDAVERAVLDPALTKVYADGKTRPVVAIRLTDGAGRSVRAGRLIEVEISPPYQTAAAATQALRDPLAAPLSTQSAVPVGQNGVALIELEPTVETGPLKVTIKLASGAERTLHTYVKPALRDWIIVGLAEGKASLEKETGANATARDLLGDGRIAGFAKGVVKGDWLVTIAGDSESKRRKEDDELFDVINPDERYPLYGDHTNQSFEAQSRYPVFLKAEKGAFKAQLGDYHTGLTQSQLARYDRRLSGVQTVYEGQRFGFTGFAAETNQAFVKDELAADGTSGPYRLSAAPLVRNSETIVIETRDRFRPDIILATTTLVRYADYEIDFDTGEIILRLPTPAADASFNPNVLVVDYETSAPIERNLTAGGRGSVKLLGGRAELGASFIHETAPGVDGDRTNVAGVDFTADLTDADEIRLEYAKTSREGPTVDEIADAILIEANHTGERLTAKAFFSDIAKGFGFGQQSSATAGQRRYGAEASVKVDEFESAKGDKRGSRHVDAKAYREENLSDGADRSVIEIGFRQESNSTSGQVGLRGVRENPATGAEREGLFVIAAVRQSFENIGLSLRAAREEPIAGDNASSLFPRRTSLGFDQRFLKKFTLSATHEIMDSDTQSQSNTMVGLAAEPWSGGKITLAGDRLMQDSAERIGATFGIDQEVRLSPKWTGSLGMARREDLKERSSVDTPDDIAPDIPISPFEQAGGAYTSLYIGAGYRDKATSGSSRFEIKKSEVGQRYMVTAGAARELTEELSFAAAGRFQQENNEVTLDQRQFEARIGASWRPHDDGLVIFNRLDVKQSSTDLEAKSWKAVHNLAINATLAERLQIALSHGFKYSVLTTDGVRHDGVTELVGLEARYDITDRIDIGFHGEGLYSFNAGTLEYAYGPTIGFTPADNVWLSFGWNFAGFYDEDFAGAEYSRSGPYLKLRIKFDQQTARGLLDAISPDRAQ